MQPKQKRNNKKTSKNKLSEPACVSEDKLPAGVNIVLPYGGHQGSSKACAETTLLTSENMATPALSEILNMHNWKEVHNMSQIEENQKSKLQKCIVCNKLKYTNALGQIVMLNPSLSKAEFQCINA